MNEERSFERFVADNVAGSSNGIPLPDDFYDDMHAYASHHRQRPEWLALIKEPPMRISSSLAVGSPMARVVAITVATLLLVLMVAGAGIAGSRLLSPMPDDGTVFPTGTFVAVEWGDYFIEFNEDGTCSWTTRHNRFAWDCTYVVDGDLYTEMTSESWPLGPATYHWDYDGEFLNFALRGEDPIGERRDLYQDQPYRYVPNPREIVLAAYDIAAGTTLLAGHTELRVVPGDEAPADALTDRDVATGSLAAVAISKGQLITPDLLEASSPTTVN